MTWHTTDPVYRRAVKYQNTGNKRRCDFAVNVYRRLTGETPGYLALKPADYGLTQGEAERIAATLTRLRRAP